MGVIYWIIGYLLVGYVITLVTAIVAPPSQDAEKVDVMTLVVTTCWGLIALAILGRILCVPVLSLRRVRLNLAARGQINEQ